MDNGVYIHAEGKGFVSRIVSSLGTKNADNFCNSIKAAKVAAMTQARLLHLPFKGNCRCRFCDRSR